MTLQPIRSAAAGPATPEPTETRRAELARAATMMEGLFLRQLFQAMRATIPEGGLLQGGMGQRMFEEMLDGAIADEAAQTRSIGLAELLEEHLGAKGVSGARSELALFERELGAGTPDAGRVARAAARFASVAGADSATTRPDLSPPSLPAGTIEGVQFEPPRRPEAIALDDDNRFSSPLGLGGGDIALDASYLLSAPHGSPVVASAPGTVVERGDTYLVVAHRSGYVSRYSHLEQPEAEVGDLVLRGQTLGQADASGAIGFSLGTPHKTLEPAEIRKLFERAEKR